MTNKLNKNNNQSSQMKRYWQENIEAFGKFYDKQSDENIEAPFILDSIYRSIIFPLEKGVTLKRYRITLDFLDRRVQNNMHVVDLGCGTGIFTTEILFRGAKVTAVDFVNPALNATKKRVEEFLPESSDNVQYLLLDIMEEPLPKSDIVIAIGVTPYIHSLEIFFQHILPTTDIFYCLFLNDKHWINKIRKEFCILNVRNYYFHDSEKIKHICERYRFNRFSRKYFGSCFLDEYVKFG